MSATITAWALRLFSKNIESSGLKYREARQVVENAIKGAMTTSTKELHLKREAARALIDATRDAGPSTLRDTL